MKNRRISRTGAVQESAFAFLSGLLCALVLATAAWVLGPSQPLRIEPTRVTRSEAGRASAAARSTNSRRELVPMVRPAAMWEATELEQPLPANRLDAPRLSGTGGPNHRPHRAPDLFTLPSIAARLVRVGTGAEPPHFSSPTLSARLALVTCPIRGPPEAASVATV